MTNRILLTLFVTALPLAGQTREYGPVSLELPRSTRAMAMGGAFQLTDPGSDGIFYNPSLLVEDTRFGLSRTSFNSEATFLTMSASTGWWGGGVGLGLQALSYTTNAVNVREILNAEEDLLTSGQQAASELVATVGYSRSIGDFSWGVSAKTVEHRLEGTKDLAGAVDLGVSVLIGRFRVGLAAQHFGTNLHMGESTLDLANQVTAGASFQRWIVGPFDLGASAALSREADGTVTPALGGEVAWWPVVGRTFTGWIGIRPVENGPSPQLTFGGAFYGDALGMEYAFQDFGSFGNAHRFGINWR
ncbi:MAG: hypothetical protein VYD78_07495 [Gemmatimonadota bacterium]|nr:hypothetical protein [Gemmatimonadota bacterium]